jgi:predicted nucleotidyltransferase component of viral defense system
MDKKLREAQELILKVFAKQAEDFALAGGTALELYYLHHRFSADLDFFSVKYKISEIEKLVDTFKNYVNKKIKLEAEFIAGSKAKVRFYTLPVQGSKRALKLDFVEETLIMKPKVKEIKGVRVYSIEDLYLHKISAISGTQIQVDEIGRQTLEGRNQARDVFDLYILSKKIKPLHIFLKDVSAQFQRGIIHWYRTFSRQELKISLIDLDIYDVEFDSKEMISYLESEIKLFTREVIEE